MAWFPDTTEVEAHKHIEYGDVHIEIGDRVERITDDVKCRTGQVTGFAPNDYVEILLDNGQSRVWAANKLKVIGAVEPVAAPAAPEAAVAPSALPPPPNHERLSPEAIPADPDRFKAWIHFACVEWPVRLMIAACQAKYTFAGEHNSNPYALEIFREEYSRWWSLSEEQREQMMSREQVDSERRGAYRREATRLARGFSSLEISRRNHAHC